VLRYQPNEFPITPQTTYGPGQTIDSAHSTGVAVDSFTGNVYVNDRTYVAVYDSAGNPVLDEGEPLRIGAGSLGDGYGIAVSGFFDTRGFVYVPDAADGTVKVFDPATDTDSPIAILDGEDTPEGRFVSLRDAAIAVDNLTGKVFVVDNQQPDYYERPEAAVYGFDFEGGYGGRLKFNVVDAKPAGLAARAGSVYVTSGNTLGAAVYAYDVDALTAAAFPAPEAAVASGALVAASAAPTMVPSPFFATPAPTATQSTSATAAIGAQEKSRPRARRRHARHRLAGRGERKQARHGRGKR
jgi:DNA-binding beta-propeller fold protein YncE